MSTNPTYLPDDIITTLTPVLLFRHPALSIPSLYRVASPESVAGIDPEDEDWTVWTTYTWTKYIYDYFVSIGTKPIVVEAQDYIYDTEATMNCLCRSLGIDENGWTDKWDPLPKEHWPDHEVGNAMTGDMMGSCGVERRGKEVRNPRGHSCGTVLMMCVAC
jgi:hypothetical protein